MHIQFLTKPFLESRRTDPTNTQPVKSYEMTSRRYNCISVLSISLLCLLLIFVSHRLTNSDYYTRLPAAAIAGSPASAASYQHHQPNALRAAAAHRSRDHQNHRTSQARRFQSDELLPFDAAAAEAANIALGIDAGMGANTFAPPINVAAMSANDILTAQRAHIASEMLNFEFVGAGQSLASLAPETGGQPMRSLILTTWRSGSTFLGDILNAMPANFYHYEPLLNYDIRQLRPGDGAAAGDAVRQLRQLLGCNYTGSRMAEYLEFGRTHNYQFNHNGRLWRWCRQRPQLCADAQFLGAFCAAFPLQSMKVVRLRLALAEELLSAEELGGMVRVVLLVRDPRGVLQSRKHREWCPGRADCDRPRRLCGDMVADWKAARRLQERWTVERVKVVRYEDLSLEPYARTQELLGFYGLPFDVAVEEFLDSHTRSDVGGVSSTFRDSKQAPFRWMAEMGWREVQEVQEECAEAMRLWGYAAATSREDLRVVADGNNGTGFNPLGNSTVGWTWEASGRLEGSRSAVGRG